MTGTGSCTTNFGATLAYPSFSLVGLWTCQGGEASGGGGITWSNSSLTPITGAVITAVGGPGTIEVWIRNVTLSFEAHGNFAWAQPADLATCEAGGSIAREPLVGTLTFGELGH